MSDLGVGGGRVGGHVKELPRVKLDAGEEDDGDRVAVLGEEGEDVIVAEAVFAGARGQFHQRRGGVKPLERDVRRHGVIVGRERLGLDDDFVALPKARPKGGGGR